ncbi:hypothetical protein D041_5020B, partial [Vibrio parahaemolyticus EKP-008]
FNLPVVIVAI